MRPDGFVRQLVRQSDTARTTPTAACRRSSFRNRQLPEPSVIEAVRLLARQQPPVSPSLYRKVVVYSDATYIVNGH
jgi:hypothetical protein